MLKQSQFKMQKCKDNPIADARASKQKMLARIAEMKSKKAGIAHTMRVIDPSGDIKVVWHSGNDDEVEQARKVFTDLRAKGFSAFKVNKDGSASARVDVFDPKSEALILVPRIAGG